MAKNKKTVLKNSLNELVKKFSENDVIARMEKEYQSQRWNNVSLSLIDDNYFVKKVQFSPDSINRISDGIIERGLYNPLIVRPCGSHYELILGRRRYFGAKKAGLHEVPCVIVDAKDEETLLMLLADNRDQREANVVEMAILYNILSKQFNYNASTLASLSHTSRSQVINILRLLRLPENILLEVSSGNLSYGHARAILSLNNEEMLKIVKRIHEENLSVRDTENIVRQINTNYQSPILDLSLEIKDKVGAKNVLIKSHSIILDFNDEEEKNKFIDDLLKK